MTKYRPTSKKYSLWEENWCDSKEDVANNYSWVEDLVIEEKDAPFSEWILQVLPEEFRGTISFMAYEKGHSAGEDEVNLIMTNLVSDLLPAIHKFKERIERESKQLSYK